MRAKIVPATRDRRRCAKAGAGFAGFAIWFDMTPADPDILVMPDPDSAHPAALEAGGRLGHRRSDDGRQGGRAEPAPGAQARDRRRGRRDGYELKTGVECEYFLIPPDGRRDLGRRRHAGQALLRPAGADAPLRRHRRDLRLHDRARLEALPERPRGRQRPVRDELGLRRRAADRRQARLLQVHGEVDRREARAARDLHAEAVRQPHRQRLPRARFAVATRAARTCSTMPRASSACPRTAIISSAASCIRPKRLRAITNPTVNSYKRINAPPTLSGATWSPNTVTYAGNNRTHMIRIPDAGRFELRLADGAANPYLLQAALLAAGLDGIQQQARSGQAPRHQHVYRGPQGEGREEAAAQPARCAARARASRRCCRTASARNSSPPTSSSRHDDWNAYSRHLTEWERADDARLLRPKLAMGRRE